MFNFVIPHSRKNVKDYLSYFYMTNNRLAQLGGRKHEIPRHHVDLFPYMKFMERRGSSQRKIISETEKLPGYAEDLRQEFHPFTTDFCSVLKNVNYNIVTRDHDSGYDTEHDARRVAMLDFRRIPKIKKARNHCTPSAYGASDSGHPSKIG